MSALEPGEQWKAVPGFPNYEVSSLGRARSWVAPGHPEVIRPEPRILKPVIISTGYRMLRLPTGTRSIHRLVCELFNGPKPEGAQMVRHLDGDSLNNYATNLAWGTQKDNMADAKRHGTDPAGERNPAAKLTAAQVSEMRRRFALGDTTKRSLASEFGVTESTAGHVINGKNWKGVAA